MTTIRIAFAGGYTAGHLTPGFALIEALGEHHPDAEVLFLGSQIGPEKMIVKSQKLPFIALPSLPFSRGKMMHKVRSLSHLPGAMWAALKVLRSHRITHLFVLGGHASFTPGIAAWLMRKPVFVIEPNSSLGLANRILARFATTIFVTSLFKETLPKSIQNKVSITGAPLRRAIRERLKAVDQVQKSTDGSLHVLVLGGSLGHHAINSGLPKITSILAKRGVLLDVVHQAGVKVNVDEIRNAYNQAGVKAHVESYISDMAQAYKRCDVIISAAGAITLAELSMVHRPVVLVPLHDSAAAHQADNASEFAAKTGALVIADPNRDAYKMVDHLYELSRNYELKARLGAQMEAFATPNAAQHILISALKAHSDKDEQKKA